MENPLQQIFPYGSIASRKWLLLQGISDQTIRNHIRSGKFQPIHSGIYCWNEFPPKKWATLASMHRIIDTSISIGGLSALMLHGFSHYLTVNEMPVHIYSLKSAPRWIRQLFETIGIQIEWHSSGSLWGHDISQLSVKEWRDPS